MSDFRGTVSDDIFQKEKQLFKTNNISPTSSLEVQNRKQLNAINQQLFEIFLVNDHH